MRVWRIGEVRDAEENVLWSAYDPGEADLDEPLQSVFPLFDIAARGAADPDISFSGSLLSFRLRDPDTEVKPQA